MVYNFDINKIQDYVENICNQHVEIMHNVGGIKSFARFRSEEEVITLRDSAGKNVVVVAGLNGRRVGHKDDMTFQREMILRIVSYAENNTAEAIKAAIAKSEELVFDIMTKMEAQQETDMDNNVCGVMHYLQPENFNWEEIEDQPWLINHFGWDLVVPFKVYMPKLNPDKWTAGTAIVETGKLTFIMRFRVGPGAPMDQLATLLNHASFANRTVLVIASSSVLPVDDGSGDIDFDPLITRHVKKLFASTQIEFVGGVVFEEIIEIYAFEM